MISLNSLLETLNHPDISLPLLGSVIAGSLIGAEREFQGKAAGLRTHILVCFASALMTLAALRMGEWTAILPEGTQIVSDMSRMPHAILTGIGFLGAGVIFREGLSVQGLTTAASLWLTAAIGITFGTGLLELAITSTAIALAVLLLLRFAQRFRPHRPEVIVELIVGDNGEFDLERMTSLLIQHGLQPGAASIGKNRAAETWRYKMPAAIEDSSFDVAAVACALSNEAAVLEFSISPIDKVMTI